MAVYWSFRAFIQIQFFGFARAEQMNIKVSDMDFPPPVNRLSTPSVSAGFSIIMLVGVALCLVPALS